MYCRWHLRRADSSASLLPSRLAPLVAPVRERRIVTAQAGGAASIGAFGKGVSGDPNRELRRLCLDRRRALGGSYRRAASRAIARKLIRSRDFARARRIAVYLSLDDEVDIDLIIRAAWRGGKSAYAPCLGRKRSMSFRALDEHTPIAQNAFGIPEPVGSLAIPVRELDLVIVPLVAFDTALHRIGMGGGYYDRCFAFTKHRHNSLPPRLLGVAFTSQRVARIDTAPWDIPLSRVVSDS